MCSILAMSVKNSKEMLVIRRAKIRRENEVILIFLIYVINTKSLTCWVRKPCDHIRIKHLRRHTYWALMLFYSERLLFSIVYTVVIVNSLVCQVYRRDYLGWLTIHCWRRRLNNRSYIPFFLFSSFFLGRRRRSSLFWYYFCISFLLPSIISGRRIIYLCRAVISLVKW